MRCFICGKRYKNKKNNGIGIKFNMGTNIHFVNKIQNDNDGKIYKLCPNCIKAVAFGVSIESQKFEIIGLEPKYEE